jgi:hypothetical protein
MEKNLKQAAPLKLQRGFSLLGMMFWGGIAACLFVVGAQVVPTVIEYQAILKASKKAANEGNSVAEVRAIYDRAAAIDNMSSVTGKDLEVTKEGDKIVVSFAYQREIPLAGPASLLLKYQGRSK